MSDSRVDRVMEGGDDTFVGYDDDEIDGIISGLEASGLVVIDPDDVRLPGLIGTALWNGTDEFLPMISVRKVIAALRGQR